MKKMIYALLIAVVSSMAISACTSEEIAPSKNEAPPGGSGIEDPLG